ncbi:MAG: hypothetical protein AAGC53_15560 [Actinomycetota bacterium]
MDRALTAILGLVVAAVAVLLGLAVVLTVMVDDVDDIDAARVPIETGFASVEHDPDAARDLLDAWTRWRTGTFVATGTWTRTLDERPDDPLVGDVFVAQDPPQRLVVRLGSVVTAIDDAERFERVLVAELSLIGGYVLGPERLYDVSSGDSAGCYRAELVVPALASPWGRWAEYCFDGESGALLSATVRRQSALDVEQTRAIRAEVSPDDFS